MKLEQQSEETVPLNSPKLAVLLTLFKTTLKLEEYPSIDVLQTLRISLAVITTWEMVPSVGHSGIFLIQLFTQEKFLSPWFHAEIPEGCLSKKVSTLLLHTGHLLDIQESINGFKTFFFLKTDMHIGDYWWKLQYCNRRHFISENKNFMKIVVHLIWVCKHSDIKFESKTQFCKYVKNCPEIS